MNERAELVTAALLGTDRRARTSEEIAGAEPDPARELLDRAARSAVAGRAGRRLPTAEPLPRVPPDTRTQAAPEAQAILRRIVDPPQVELVNVWLATAAAYGVGVSPAHWPALVRLATRDPEVDRGDLAAGLGAAGLWFVAQNAQWARLESALRRPPPPRATPPAGPTPDAQAVREHPDTIFGAPPPWPRYLLESVLAVLESGRLQWGAVGYARAVGARMPLEHYPLVRSAAHAATEQPAGGGRGRSIRDAFAALEATAGVRAEIHRAFQDQPAPGSAPDNPEEPR